jgi:hypothetical protein
LGYNTNLVKPAEVPKTYEELLSARWKGNNISIDQEGYELLQGLVLSWGKEKAAGFLKKLAAQNPTPRRGNSLRVQLVVAGEYPLLITMASPVQLARREGAPIQWIPLEPVPGQLSRHCVGRARGSSKRRETVYRLCPVTRRPGSAPQRTKDSGAPRRRGRSAELDQGYARVMLRPMEKEEFDEVVELYKQIFNLR